MDLFNAEEEKIIQIVANLALSGTVCLFGVFFNIVNIIVFLKQGLRKTVNISLFAISISDLCSLVTVVWISINSNPFIESADIPYKPLDILYLTGTWPHTCFLQITIWITVYMTAERFVCIALPLKVKQIFTPHRTKVVISVIYLLMFLIILPLYVCFYFGEDIDPSRNTTLVVLKKKDIILDWAKLVFIIFTIGEIVSFVTLTVVTFLFVVTLRRTLKWRMTATPDSGQCLAVSTRGTRTMKMVGLVSGALIVFATPGVLISIAVISVYGFQQNGTFSNVIWSFSFVTEAISATVNSVFFYKMSSKYKQNVDGLFSRCISHCHGNCVTNEAEFAV